MKLKLRLPRFTQQFQTNAIRDEHKHNLEPPTNIKGSGGWELHFTGNWWSKTAMIYSLYTDIVCNEDPYMHILVPPRIPEDEYLETKGYFYAPIKLPNGMTAYRYIAQAEGGAILFRGKGRWSGNAYDFGLEMNKDMVEITLCGFAGFCMEKRDIERILATNFPRLIVTIERKYGWVIVIDWTKQKNW